MTLHRWLIIEIIIHIVNERYSKNIVISYVGYYTIHHHLLLHPAPDTFWLNSK